MKRIQRSSDGYYHINGKLYAHLIGTRKQVYYHKTAYKTPGGLTIKELIFNKKTGRIVSKNKHLSAKKEQRLLNNGYGTKKGHFGYVMRDAASKRTRSGRKGNSSRRRSQHGGWHHQLPNTTGHFDPNWSKA